MPIGHGLIDYIVVFASVLLTMWLLQKKPVLLLLWLPSLLTIDFFIPFMTQLTPSRIVPLFVGVWLVLKGYFPPTRQHQLLFIVSIFGVGLSFIYSFFVHDLGTRAIFRSLHYLSLLFVFIFVARMARSREGLAHGFLGLLLAGLLHAFHAGYQQIANFVSLPYRGVIYSEGGSTVPVMAGPFLRVNGLADEPKRLGYILLTAALIGVLFMMRKRYFSGYIEPTVKLLGLRNNLIMTSYILLMLVCGLMTFSGSFLFAMMISSVLLLAMFSVRVVYAALILTPVVAIAAVLLSDTISDYSIVLEEMYQDRVAEINAGLDSDNIYRQEFFAQALVEENPDTLIFGLGMGRYNIVFYENFGFGAGYDEFGALKPLNSQFFEVGFDLGLIGLLVFYAGGMYLFFVTRGKNWHQFALSTTLLFLIVQSLFVDDKFHIAIVAALCVALRNEVRTDRRRVRSHENVNSGPTNRRFAGSNLKP